MNLVNGIERNTEELQVTNLKTLRGNEPVINLLSFPQARCEGINYIDFFLFE